MTRDEPEIAWMCHFDDMFLPNQELKSVLHVRRFLSFERGEQTYGDWV